MMLVVRVPNRYEVRKELFKRDIEVGLHYPISLHLQKAYQDIGYRPGDFPESEAAAESVASLPIFPHITEEQVDHVCRTLINRFTQVTRVVRSPAFPVRLHRGIWVHS